HCPSGGRGGNRMLWNCRHGFTSSDPGWAYGHSWERELCKRSHCQEYRRRNAYRRVCHYRIWNENLRSRIPSAIQSDVYIEKDIIVNSGFSEYICSRGSGDELIEGGKHFNE